MSNASREQNHHRNEAVGLLVHYLGLAGIKMTGDAHMEIAAVVDNIIDAAVEEMSEKIKRRSK